MIDSLVIHTKSIPLKALVCIALLSTTLAVESRSTTHSTIEYKVTPNVTYGHGEVIRGETKISRDLWMDVFEPVEEAQTERPAVIMTFGGAFHRGGPRNTFEVDGARDTSMGDYCREFAMRGYVCFAVDYRLAPEHPVASMSDYSEDDLDLKSFNFVVPQMNKVRAEMGLSALDTEDPGGARFVRDVVLSAAEDLNKAVGFVRDQAQLFRVDPDRIVLGGFSAGAVAAWNVGHGMRAPVAGVFTLSGGNIGFDIARSLSVESPPSLMFLGENDLDQAHEAMALMLRQYEKAEARYTFAWVPGFGHFYPSGAVSLAGDASKVSVMGRILEFLHRAVGEI